MALLTCVFLPPALHPFLALFVSLYHPPLFLSSFLSWFLSFREEHRLREIDENIWTEARVKVKR
jgi:hypothetical protein